MIAASALSLLLLLPSTAGAQNGLEVAQLYIRNNLSAYGLSEEDIGDWVVSDNYVSRHTGLNHIYFQQTVGGTSVEGAVLDIHVTSNGDILTSHSRFSPGVHATASRLVTTTPDDALRGSLVELGIPIPSELREKEHVGGNTAKVVYEAFDGVSAKVPVELAYVDLGGKGVRLVWKADIELSRPDWHIWTVYTDASTGEYLRRVDRVLSFAPNSYQVYAPPVESPNHGVRATVTDPADTIASPFGWHDTDGAAGAEFTITRGNNVYAQEDQNGNDGTGYAPDGGATLEFVYPLDLSQPPSTNTSGAQNLDSAITNLFYWNNIIHDVFYQYGFDGPSGNFQENNYGQGGAGSDYLIADAQDGDGTDNANFATPADGSNPRMQMYLWTGGGTTTRFDVNSPAGIAGSYGSAAASFGPSIPEIPLTANLVIADDGTAIPSEGCSALTNAAAINGNVALVDRGSCQFSLKVLNAENAGALAAVVCNNVPGAPFGMPGGTSGASVTIPSIMISQADCAAIRTQIPTVNVTIQGTPQPTNFDGDFDTGIVAHEYGHGISTRLTGGPSNSDCLGNSEQAGEGWSDFFALFLTHEPGDTRTTARGVATYAIGQSPSGGGIRTYPYTTDMVVNPFTYDSVKTEAIPHGVGSVFATMLWDLYWDLVDAYGNDPDLYHGTGGNNIAMRLVIDGLKLQPCNPGFVDMRNAILMADQINYGGTNESIIWTAFARRGLGNSASQGSTASNMDGTEAFDLPPWLDPVLTIFVDGFESGDLSAWSSAS